MLSNLSPEKKSKNERFCAQNLKILSLFLPPVYEESEKDLGMSLPLKKISSDKVKLIRDLVNIV